MRFYVKNRFVLNKITKMPGEIIDITADMIEKLTKADVLGAPVKEVVIETEMLKPVENEMINRSIKREGEKPIKKINSKGKK